MVYRIPAFILIWSLSFPVCAGQWFTENMGQLLNDKEETVPGIKFYSDHGGKRLFFTDTSIFYAERSNMYCCKRFQRAEEAMDISENALFLSAGEKLPFQFHYYLPGCPNGILGVSNYLSLIYSDTDGNPVYEIIMDEMGELILTKPDEGILIRSIPPLPLAIPWSTFLGGNDADETWGVDHDGAGNVIVCGQTMSIDFPSTPGSMQDTSRGMYDTFISKFDMDGNLLWSTFYGSTDNDFAGKIITGSDQSIYFVGYTPGLDLPVSLNCFQNANAGGYDAFLIKLTPSGSRIWATYFGGNGGDLGLAIARDANQNIFFGGSSTSMTFPVTIGAWQTVNNGPMECFITKFDSSGGRTWCTFYGGTGSEDIHAMSAGPSGEIVVIGGTFSTDFPVSSGCFQNFNAGIKDLFILKFDATGSRLFSTYCGGTAFEDGSGVSVDAVGGIFISGTTASFNFPVTIGCYQPSSAGGDDAFIMRFDPNGSQDWSTYFGGNGTENAYGLDSPGNDMYYMAISTNSINIPVIGPGPFSSLQGSTDAFIVKFNRYGQPSWSTYYGGSLQDIPHHISVDNQMRVAITGLTSSVDYPVTFGAYQISNNGNDDAFVTELDGSFDNTLNAGYNEPGTIPDVYPNPVCGTELFISMEGPHHFEGLYDLSGRKFDFSPEYTRINDRLIRFSGFAQPPSGIYFLKLVSESDLIYLELIFER